jgi:hypothetical protein
MKRTQNLRRQSGANPRNVKTEEVAVVTTNNSATHVNTEKENSCAQATNTQEK